MTGMVFLIIATPIEEFDFEHYERYEGINWMFSNTVIGTDEEYVYEIIHPGYPEEFYDDSTLESTTAYLNHLYSGLSLLEYFAEENNLELNSDWSEHYFNLTIAPVEEQLAFLQRVTAQNTVVIDDAPLKYSLPVELYSEGCVEFSEDGKTMTFFDPINRELVGYNSGRIWWLNIYTKEEFAAVDHSYDEFLDSDWYGFMSPSGFMYAMDSEYVYVLNTPTDAQYLPDGKDSYLSHMQAGIEILESVIELNSLTLNPHWNDRIIEDLFPELIADTLSTLWHSVSSRRTDCTTDENRTTNMELACAAIDGMEIQPGETFSFNDALGERTVEKGYREAPVYTTADSEPAIGGGISQVASTLYACCLYADLEITERQGHSFYESYLPGGMDAAVYWDSTDFKFRNNTDSTIRIRAYINEGSLWVELQSPQNPQFTADITMDYSTTDAEMTYRLTRHIYDPDGNLIRTDTTEDLDAMGGLGTTVYTIQNVATEAEEAASPAAEVTEYPAYAVMEEDLVTTNGVAMGMTPEEVIRIMGTPLEESRNADGSTYLNYQDAYFSFGICSLCEKEHLTNIGLHNPCNLMPLGLDIGTPLEEVLSQFDAEDAEPSYTNELYRVDDRHFAVYTPVSDTGLVSISIAVGEFQYEISFDRKNEIYMLYIYCVSASANTICPQN